MTAELAPLRDGALLLDDEVAERLAALDQAAVAYLDTTTKPNTRRAYGDDWRTWTRFCAELRIPAGAATLGTLVGFVNWLYSAGNAPSTVDRRLAGVSVTFRDAGRPIDKPVMQAARKAMAAEADNLARANERRGRGKAPAVTVAQLRLMCRACPSDTLAGIRDRALLLIGFAIAARRSELASLHVSDVVEVEEGLIVTVRFGKRGAREVAVPYGSNPLTCPVRAWRAWLAASGLVEGPAFRWIDRHDKLRDRELSGQAVGDVVTRVAGRAGLAGRTAHGLRSGLATEARRAGHDSVSIAAQGGWSPTSRDLFGYMQIVDRWADNAAAGLGL
ncbi:site-specific integrase [Nonomuraea endophytica]|uniref:Integrase n=1 Tax=Nonomuraea endophytica TaxID=714136 RepID=A0A7W8EJ92_9ACTN|nr:site-specific integrase [Nonomuraea endophytica]MBB5081353.1 integrase [Nonomuraea endophytica]